MKKVLAICLLLLVFSAGLLVGLAQNIKPEQLEVYQSVDCIMVKFPDGNVWEYN
jgi:hypothetical protein